MQFLPGFSSLAESYEAFILDLWGVVHDGAALYPGVKECLGTLRARGKKILLLSNAPRRAAKVVEVLDRLGLWQTLYDSVLTSGDASYDWLAAQPPLAYYLLGPERDAGLVDGLKHRRVPTLEEAELIVNVGFEYDLQPYAELAPLIEKAAALGLPMLCANPDMEVVKISGERWLCAGYSAREFEKLGGKAIYFGKPHRPIYDRVFERLGGIAPEKILAVGDTLATDIAGAHGVSLKAALVTGGVLSACLSASSSPEETLKSICAGQAIFPDFVIPALRG